MNESRIKKLLKQGEGLQIEFKTCRDALNRDVFESVCAFLNRFGGDLLLGVRDNGEVTGVAPDAVDRIKNDFVTALNNLQKISPPFYLSIEAVTYEGKSVLHVAVPESSQAHRCNGKIFDRNEDGDFNITDNTGLVAALYQRKQSSYAENKIYPYVKLEHLRRDWIAKARKMAINQRPNHPWATLDDLELLKSAQLYQQDFSTGKEGFTLAAILLLGHDDVILSVLSHHRTDAILRRENLDRYDDRDDIRTNLLESYERLTAFIAKHLPDLFYLEGDQRISLRDHIFREVVANMLIHRDFLNVIPAKLVIEQQRVLTENSNKPHGHGLIDVASFSPFPKNPVIARFFKEIGWADELGSGVRNLFKYSVAYGGKEPQLMEGDVFKTIVTLRAPQATQQATPQATPQASKLLVFCSEPRSREEMQHFMGLKDREHFRKALLVPLLDQGLLKLTMPDKPTSPKQKYSSIADKGANDE
ncbi:MAG: putative DNA binding domain-containing protein [Mariprofundaceae bacterium]|nr:putative DNA binding domain-containing protein [Mariprofundaceae bacterium]